jgi:hypothetical protein
METFLKITLPIVGIAVMCAGFYFAGSHIGQYVFPFTLAGGSFLLYVPNLLYPRRSDDH